MKRLIKTSRPFSPFSLISSAGDSGLSWTGLLPFSSKGYWALSSAEFSMPALGDLGWFYSILAWFSIISLSG
jgi:hypothetical protein